MFNQIDKNPFTNILYVVCFIILTIVLFGLGITDIMISSKWLDCNMTDPRNYLNILGGLRFSFVFFAYFSETNIYNIYFYISLISFIVSIGILIWGTQIFFGTNVNDCVEGYYKYGYYRTLVEMFFWTGLTCIFIVFGIIWKIYHHIKTKNKNISHDITVFDNT